MNNTIKKVGLWSSIVAAVTSIGIVGYLAAKPSSSNLGNPQVLSNVENSEIELIAITPEGTKVYKVKNNKIIVPLVIVQSPNGNLAIR